MKNASKTILILIVAGVGLAGLSCRKPTTTSAGPQTAPGTVSAVPPGSAEATIEAMPAAPPSQAPEALAQAAHEQAALIALGDVKVAMARGDNEEAARLAKAAAKDYADTPYVQEFADLASAAQAAEAARRRQQESLSEAQRAERADRFARYRDTGVEAMNRKDFPSAVTMLQDALAEQEDDQVRALLEQARAKATKPRVAVLDFAVTGEIGIDQPGRAASELMLTRLDPGRFQLVERARLADILAEKDLTISQLAGNSQLLVEKKLSAVQFLIFGAIVRMNDLHITARLVDAGTSDIVNTAEVAVNDIRGLSDALRDLAALLQMNEQEKAAYIQRRQREQQDLARRQAEEAARAAAMAEMAQEERLAAQQRAQREQEALRMEAALAWRLHQQEALEVLADARALLARGKYRDAAASARFGIERYGDTRLARPYVEVLTEAERGLAAQREAQLRERHERFVKNRQDGLTAMAAKDYAAAVAAFREALHQEEDAQVRQLLAQAIQKLTEQNGKGLAVADLLVDRDLRQDGSDLAHALAQQAGSGGGKYKPLDRGDLLEVLRLNGLRMAQVATDPLELKGKSLGELRFLVVGKVAAGEPIKVSARLYDLRTGGVLASAVLAAQSRRNVMDTARDVGGLLTMDEGRRDEFVKQNQRYQQLLAKADLSAAAGAWQDAMETYQQAYALQGSPEAKQGLEQAKAKLKQQQAMMAAAPEPTVTKPAPVPSTPTVPQPTMRRPLTRPAPALPALPPPPPSIQLPEPTSKPRPVTRPMPALPPVLPAPATKPAPVIKPVLSLPPPVTKPAPPPPSIQLPEPTSKPKPVTKPAPLLPPVLPAPVTKPAPLPPPSIQLPEPTSRPRPATRPVPALPLPPALPAPVTKPAPVPAKPVVEPRVQTGPDAKPDAQAQQESQAAEALTAAEETYAEAVAATSRASRNASLDKALAALQAVMKTYPKTAAAKQAQAMEWLTRAQSALLDGKLPQAEANQAKAAKALEDVPDTSAALRAWTQAAQKRLDDLEALVTRQREFAAQVKSAQKLMGEKDYVAAGKAMDQAAKAAFLDEQREQVQSLRQELARRMAADAAKAKPDQTEPKPQPRPSPPTRPAPRR